MGFFKSIFRSPSLDIFEPDQTKIYTYTEVIEILRTKVVPLHTANHLILDLIEGLHKRQKKSEEKLSMIKISKERESLLNRKDPTEI